MYYMPNAGPQLIPVFKDNFIFIFFYVSPIYFHTLVRVDFIRKLYESMLWRSIYSYNWKL